MDGAEEKNYYEILDIPVQSSQEEIIQGYQKIKSVYSSDSSALYSILDQSECERILETIETAFSVLSNPAKRQEYNNHKGLKVEYFQSHSHNNHLEESINHSVQQPSDNLINLKGQIMQENFIKESQFKIIRKEAEVSKIAATNKFKLNYEVNPEFEQVIENTSEFTGDLLRKIREYKNVSIERMSDLTKISKTYIKQIENEEVDKLPAKAYIRGFVYQYAKCLKLMPDLVATSYLNNIKNL